MTTLLRIVPVLVLLLASQAAAQANRTTLLRWKWTEGSATTYRSTHEMTQEVTGSGEDRSVSWTVAYIVRQRVQSVSDAGVATVAQTYESAIIDVKEKPGEQVRYDSTRQADASKRSHRLIKPHAAFVGKTITFDVDPEGKVLRLEGASQILAEAFDGVSESNPLIAPLMQLYKATRSDDAIRAGLEKQLRVVPDRQTRIGESWNVQSEQRFPAVGTITSDLNYTFRRVTRGMAMLDAGGTLTQSSTGDPLASMLGVTMTQSRVSGSVTFDADAGQITSSNLTTEMLFEFKPMGLDAGEAKVEQRLTQKALLERIARR